MTERTITDLQVKMKAVSTIPQDMQTQIFFDMCEFGRRLYMQTEQERFPNKNKVTIMRDYYLARGNH